MTQPPDEPSDVPFNVLSPGQPEAGPAGEARPNHGKRKHRRRRGPPGHPPGQLVIDPQAPAPVLTATAFGSDRLEQATLAGPHELSAWDDKADVLWVDVQGLGDASVLSAVAEHFGLHPLALEDVVHTDQRPKIDVYDELLFIVLRASNSQRLTLEQDCVVLGDDFVLTFQELPGDVFGRVRERLSIPRSRLRSSGPDYLAYALIDALIDNFFPIVDQFAERLEQFEAEVMAGGQRADLVPRVHAIRSELLAVRRAVWPLRDMLRSLSLEGGELIHDDTRLYLRDCSDHAVMLADAVENQRETGKSLMDLHLALIGQRTNEITKVLTIIATIFIPLSFIASVYGMNFNTVTSPWNMPELNAYWGYPMALALMAGVALTLLVWFWRKRWIGRG